MSFLSGALHVIGSVIDPVGSLLGIDPLNNIASAMDTKEQVDQVKNQMNQLTQQSLGQLTNFQGQLTNTMNGALNMYGSGLGNVPGSVTGSYPGNVDPGIYAHMGGQTSGTLALAA